MASAKVRYLVFDIESVADGNLISKVRYPEKNLSAADAIKEYVGYAYYRLRGWIVV